MAATVGAWAKPGAWALDSEENEAELLKQQQNDQNNGGAYSHEPEPLAEFPSLSTAAMKPKKKKGQTFSLAEFNNGSSRSAQASQAKGLTTEDLFHLPTGPRQRSAEELDRNRLGGGFRQYGSYEGGRSNRYSNGDGDESSNNKWGGSRGSDESRGSGGFNRDSNRETMPSRADEIDDWGAAKKSTPSNGFERRERGERGERGGFFDSHSKADESDNWTSNKSFVPSSAPGRRFGGGGRGGFDNSRELSSGGSGGADSETWGKKNEIGGGIGGSGSGVGRPRLVLQPRSLPVSNEQQQQEEESLTPVVKPKASNPFGNARPREEVLAEKGQDWKKIDEELESLKIKESGGGSADGGSVGKRSFGSGSWRMSSNEDVAEKNWRKNETVDVDPPSTENVQNGHAEGN